MQIFIFILVFISMAAVFIGRYNTLKSDTEAANEVFSSKNWLIKSAIEILFSLALYVGVVIGVDLSAIMPDANLTGIMGAIITGAGIPNVVSRIIIPAIGLIFPINTARKDLRSKIDVKTNTADAIISGNGASTSGQESYTADEMK